MTATPHSAPPNPTTRRNNGRSRQSQNTYSDRLSKYHCFHIKTASIMAVVASFGMYLTVNSVFVISFRFLPAYFTILIGSLFYALFMFGYRQRNRWMIFAYFFFLGVFIAILLIILSFCLAYLHDPADAPLAYLHDEFKLGSYENVTAFYQKYPHILAYDTIMYKIMLSMSLGFIPLISICMSIVYQFFKYLSQMPASIDELIAQQRSPRDYNNIRGYRNRAHLGHHSESLGSICAISYPPPCPPAYEVEQSSSLNLPRRPAHLKFLSGPRLPQYTDFRREVYAEPPPYEEKPSSSGTQ